MPRPFEGRGSLCTPSHGAPYCAAALWARRRSSSEPSAGRGDEILRGTDDCGGRSGVKFRPFRGGPMGGPRLGHGPVRCRTGRGWAAAPSR